MPPSRPPRKAKSLRLRPFWLYRVEGESMLPTYSPADTLLGLRWFRPRVGQVVVANVHGRPLVKRIIKMQGRLVWLEGDNAAASWDSRRFGAVDRSWLEARIVRRLKS